MAKITAARLEELKRRVKERAPKSEAWKWLVIEEDKSLTEEQRAILKHNMESTGNGTAFRYLLVAKQVEPSVAPEDVSEALDELNEIGVLDTLNLFDDEQNH
jgi:hypothetical protein